MKPLLNLIAIVAAFGVNLLANIAPPSGLTVADISNTTFQEVIITPANYAFIIWGVIYLGLISLGFYQALPSQQKNATVKRLGYFLVIASLAQIAWIFLFQYQLFNLSLVAMLLILLPLIRLYQSLDIGRVKTSRQSQWLIHVPVSIYLAWISVATIVNVAVVLYNLGWSGWLLSPEIWTLVMLVVASLITAEVLVKHNDSAFALVIVWAFMAIALRHATTQVIFSSAGGLAIVILLLLLFQTQNKKIT